MEADNSSPFLSFIKDNPSASMALLGGVQGLLNQPKELAQAQAQIAQTQWSPYVGGGPGNPFAVQGEDALSRAIKGYTSGAIMEDQDKRNQDLLDALRKDDSPYKKASESVDASRVPNSVNEVEPVTEVPQYLKRNLSSEDTLVDRYRDVDRGDEIVQKMYNNAVMPGNYNQANPMTSEQFRQRQATTSSPYYRGR